MIKYQKFNIFILTIKISTKKNENFFQNIKVHKFTINKNQKLKKFCRINFYINQKKLNLNFYL